LPIFAYAVGVTMALMLHLLQFGLMYQLLPFYIPLALFAIDQN